MTHYVDGVEQGSGAVSFRAACRAGRTSIGVRQNRVSWFKGRIHTVRITPSALSPEQLLTVPAAEIALWPEGVPGAPLNASASRIEQLVDGRISNVHVPTLTMHAPAPGTANGTAMIVCAGRQLRAAGDEQRGGGHHADSDASRRHGVRAEVRLAEYGHPAPLRDVLRAVRLVRSRAAELGVQPDRIGLFGASAGGHLAASAATLYRRCRRPDRCGARQHQRASGFRGVAVSGRDDEGAVRARGLASQPAGCVAVA